MIRGLVIGLCLFIAGLLCLPASAWWQSVLQVSAGGGFTPSCTESSNFIARETSPDATQRSRGDTLLCGLVTDGLCCAATGGVLDALYVFTTNSTTNALLNWTQNAYNLTQTGTLTFSASNGYTGDGSTGFFDTGFNVSLGSRNYVQNSATVGCYSLTSRTTDQNYAMFGYLNNRDTRLYGKQGAISAGTAIFTINDNVGANTAVSANANGSWLLTRTGATTVVLYRNGASFATNANASGAPDNLNMYLFAFNNGGSAAAFDADQMGACWIGAGMDATQAGNMQSRLNTYMTAYGINVYM